MLTAMSQLVSIDRVCEVVGVPRRNLYVMAKKRLIPFYRTGGEQRALRFSIEEVIQALRVAPKVEPETTTVEHAAGGNMPVLKKASGKATK
jgi:excisionase family DNA binding protein